MCYPRLLPALGPHLVGVDQLRPKEVLTRWKLKMALKLPMKISLVWYFVVAVVAADVVVFVVVAKDYVLS